MTNLFELVALTSFRYKYLFADIADWKLRRKVKPWVVVTDVILITLLLCTHKGQTVGRIIIGSFRLKKSPGTNKLLNQLSIFFWISFTLNNGYSILSLDNCLFVWHSCNYLVIHRNLLIIMISLITSWPIIGQSPYNYEGQALYLLWTIWW